VSADSSLYLPDFRAAERTFQLLSQVSGRAGRGTLRGEIVVQTCTPTHPAILRAARHDYEGFSQHESRLRAELGYPPLGRLIRVVFEDKDAERVSRAARDCSERLRRELANDAIAILGPAVAPIGKLRGRHRHHLLVKAPADGEALERARDALIEHAAGSARPRVTIDVDPVSML